MSKQDEVRVITEAAVLSALAHPFRARLLDALKVDGPSTVSSLARRTGQAVGSVSHHLKVLADVQMVQEVPELAKDRREHWWELVSPGWRWSRSDIADDPVAEAAGRAAESVVFGRQVDRTRDWLDNHEGAADWADSAFATQSWVKLTPAELTELANEIMDIVFKWQERQIDDDLEREPVYVFARGFPSQP